MNKNGFLMEVKKNWVLFLMLLPAFVFFLFNNYLPMLGIYYAFTRFTYGKGLFGGQFVGFNNFKYLFESNTILSITFNTVAYNFVFIVLGNILQIFTAVLISLMVGKWYKRAAQSIMLLPHFVSMVVVGVLAYNFFNYDYGMLNTLLKALHFQPINVYSNTRLFPVIIVAFNLWKGLGYGMIIYLTAILGIDTEIYEASFLDGADVFQQIRYVTLPLLKPTFIILFLYSIGSILKGQFDLFYQLVGMNGVLFPTTDIIDTYVYRALLNGSNFGMGTAAGVYQSVFGFVLIVIVNAIIKRKTPEFSLF